MPIQDRENFGSKDLRSSAEPFKVLSLRPIRPDNTPWMRA